MADAKDAGTRPLPKAVIRIFFVAGAIIVTGLMTAGWVVLMLEEPDRGLGFGLVTLATLILLIGGWKFRWFQKKGLMGPPPGP